MPVLMMQVRPMRVGVGYWLMPVGMRMGFARRVIRSMLVLMMRVMDVPVGVIQRPMHMFVRMAFGEMKPCADGHEEPGHKHRARQWCAENDGRGNCADERRCAVIRSGPRCSEVAQGDNEQNQPQAIAHKTKQQCTGNGEQAGKPGTQAEGKGGIHRSCNNALDRGKDDGIG